MPLVSDVLVKYQIQAATIMINYVHEMTSAVIHSSPKKR